jgi:cyclase
MLKKRLIPVVLLKNGLVVQSKKFSRYQVLGNPVTIVERLTNWAADELIYLDISIERSYDLGRDDLNAGNRNSLLEILSDVAKCCFMPLTFGGGIRTLSDAVERVQAGADKIAINSKALEDSSFISACANDLGSQCVVVSIDALSRGADCWEVMSHRGQRATGKSPSEWAKEVEAFGAGEILINSIDNDGQGKGFDIQLIQSVAEAVTIPVIALGGAGGWHHLEEVLSFTNANAVAAANIFHYTENSVFNAKKHLYERGLNIRKPYFDSDKV